MPQTISIWQNRDQDNEMHMRVSVTDKDYNRMVELVKTENLTSTEAYDKMIQEKDNKNV